MANICPRQIKNAFIPEAPHIVLPFIELKGNQSFYDNPLYQYIPISTITSTLYGVLPRDRQGKVFPLKGYAYKTEEKNNLTVDPPNRAHHLLLISLLPERQCLD